ncbi:MAG: hypothetical protein J6T88_04320 [Bacteroidales bacterium]|nr:hypothetical protein [Bacteroidales bacterium]
MEIISLLSLFQKCETELRSQLSGLTLPKDTKKLNNILSDLFISHVKIGEYKEELTDSELAILQSAIQLVEKSLQMPFNMFVVEGVDNNSTFHETTSNGIQSRNIIPLNKSQLAVLGVTASGVLAGTLPNVGTILLAIVATATGLWVSSKSRNKTTEIKETIIPQELVVNVDAIINTAKNICQSVDNVMTVYQTNIHNLKTRIDSKPIQTLHNTYGYLLFRLADLYRDKNNNASSYEIENDIAMLFKTLKNYNYEFVGYSEETKQYFDVEELDDIDAPEESEVAILEKGICIVKGKYYKQKNN